MLRKLKKNLKKVSIIYKPYRKVINKIEHGKYLKRVEYLHKYGYGICNKISNSLLDNNIKFFYSYGSLLGLIREKEFIKHDEDIDIAVLKTDDFDWKVLENSLTKIGLKKYREFILDNEIVEQSYSYDIINIDFFLLIKEDDHMVNYGFIRYDNNEYESNYDFTTLQRITSEVSNIIECYSHDALFMIPENYNEYLVDLYGPNWKIPNSKWSPEECNTLKNINKIAHANYFK